MRSIIFCFFIAHIVNSTGYSASFSSLTCRDQVLKTFSDCSSYEIFLPSTNLSSNWLQAMRCHFPNQVSIYAYEKSGRPQIDIKGLSGRDSRGQKNQTKALRNCSQLMTELKTLAKWRAPSFSASSPRPFQNQENLALIASEKNCRDLQSELSTYLDLLRSENRNSSSLICVPEALVQSLNPSLVRAFIQSELHAEEHLLLIGNDLPPFEIFYENKGDFFHGETDLPYGNSTSDFWTRPLSKSEAPLFEKVYRSQNYLYKTSSPTPFAFDLAALSEHRQERSVSRWISSKESSKEDFQRFIERRKSYRPKSELRAVMIRDGESIMFRPEDHESWAIDFKDQEEFRSNLSKGSQSFLLTEADSLGVLRNLSTETSFVHLLAHGTSNSIGGLHAADLQRIHWLPPILNLDSCSTGSWSLEEKAETSLIAKAFGILNPPLAMMASQATKFLVTLGHSDGFTREVFFNRLKPGQSLGSRQVETVNANLVRLSNEVDRTALWLQTFSILSLFGDATMEM